MFKKTILALLLIFITFSNYNNSTAQPIDEVEKEQLIAFQQVINLVKTRYVKDVSSKDLVYAGIESMLEKLDPHSGFMDPEETKRLQEDHEGSFGGLGIVISIRDEMLTIVAPIEGTPAHKLGLQAGDRIIRIEGESTEGITTQEAVRKMRGEIGTDVTVTIERNEWKDPKDFTITRGKIPVEAVPYSFMIRPGIGYIRMTRFSKNLSEEFITELNELEQEGLESLLIDLRGNPGGYMSQAIEVAQEFLNKKNLVVFTKGRIPRSSRKYLGNGSSRERDYPIVVLVNNGSASASEIVSGALQDWDRAIIAGETTFGKGLVQNIFPVSHDGAALKLTTAKYYTPSGRCIQRPYKGVDVYTYRYPDRTNVEKKEEEMKEDGEVFETVGGREVRASGGINPDIEIKAERLSDVMADLERNAYFQKFALKYMENNPIESPDEIFNNVEKYVDEFKDYLVEIDFEYEQDQFDENIEAIHRGIKRELIREYWSENANYHTAREEAYKIAVEGDSQVLKALELFPKAEQLISSGEDYNE